ncbi:MULTISPECIES: hypothetical protein [unclassified Acidocella]|uniref:hypothetical protein n=1 Tax=unclassified Acidocella TaxID=2648610 RepID=UPI00028C6738|nr:MULTISPECIES: hypothetical protein [unclassified Acidocella]EKN00253.1 hypothetical protein MXAZACID_06301 [Acidocella sp. MX-AZ02]WBO59823.1 hypothetical protein GT370_02705 [Acidocella sp. MX-AZ03]
MEKDGRIPVYIGGTPGPLDAVLVEDGHAMPPAGHAIRFTAPRFGHQPGCFCCTARGPAANAFSALYRDRAMGAAPYFERVVILASLQGEADIKAALEQDAVTKARFRLG